MPSTSGLLSLSFVCDFELRLRQADGDDGGQPFAEVLAGRVEILEDVLLLAVGVERARQRRAEAERCVPPSTVLMLLT